MAYKYVYADVSIIVNDRENCSSPFTYFAMRKFASGIKKPESSILAQCSLPAINYSSRRSLERRRKSRDCGTNTDQQSAINYLSRRSLARRRISLFIHDLDLLLD